MTECTQRSCFLVYVKIINHDIKIYSRVMNNMGIHMKDNNFRLKNGKKGELRAVILLLWKMFQFNTFLKKYRNEL